MSNQRVAVIIGAGPEEEILLRRQLQSVVDIAAVEPDPRRGHAVVKERAAQVALLYLDRDPAATLDASREIGLNGCYSVVVSRDRDPDLVLQAMRSGARDFAYLDGDDDVRRAVIGLAALGPKTAAPAPGGKLVAIFGAKGGTGATTIATNLAGALVSTAGEGGPAAVALVDADFQLGDVQAFLDTKGDYTWRSLARDLHRLDKDLLRQQMTKHRSGLHVLAQTSHPEEAEELDGRVVGRALDLLRAHYDYVVADGLSNFSDTSLAILDRADAILLVLTQDVPSLKNAHRILELFKRLGYDGDKTKVVVNRYTKRAELTLDTIADALGQPVAHTIANDFPAVTGAINKGDLLSATAPRAEVTTDIAAMVGLLGSKPAEQRRGLFARLVGR